MKFKTALMALTLWSVDLFFCLCNMFVTSEQTSSLLRVFSAGMAAIIVLLFFFRKSLSFSELRVLLFPLIILCVMLFIFLLNGDNDLAKSDLLYFLCYAIPMTLLATVCYKNDTTLHAGEFADLLLILFDLYFIFIAKNGLFTDVSVRELQEETNIGYQSTSYFGAYAFGISLYALLFQTKKTYKPGIKPLLVIFRGGTLLFSIIVAIYGSGKGAMLLMIALAVLLFAFFLRGKKKVGALVGIIVGALAIFFIVSRFVRSSSALSSSFERIYSLLGTGNVAYETTSGRTTIYDRCWNLFLDSPIIGYGVTGGYYRDSGLPHQMFLHIMLDGGTIYLIVWIAILITSIRKFAQIMKMDPENRKGYIFLALVFVAQILPLQFSSSYLQAYSLWFLIAYTDLRYQFVYAPIAAEARRRRMERQFSAITPRPAAQAEGAAPKPNEYF